MMTIRDSFCFTLFNFYFKRPRCMPRRVSKNYFDHLNIEGGEHVHTLGKYMKPSAWSLLLVLSVQGKTPDNIKYQVLLLYSSHVHL